MMRRFWSRIVVVFGALHITLAAAHGQTNTLVLPKEALEGYGNKFAGLIPSQDGHPVQQIYAASEFSDLKADSIWITGIALRFDDPAASMNTTILHITIVADIFDGPMSALSVHMSSNLRNPKVVLDAENFPLVAARSTSPADFTVKIPFTRPFLYERRRGQLLLQFYAGSPTSSSAKGYDAHELLPATDRGFNVIRFSNGMPGGAWYMIATEFSYVVISATIDSIQEGLKGVELDFTLSGGTPNSVRLEGAAMVQGPFALEENIQLSTISPGKIRATVPTPSADRFYRVRLD